MLAQNLAFKINPFLLVVGRSKKYAVNYRMGEDSRLEISWEDWRDYLLMSPSADFHDIVHYWRHSTVILFFHSF